MTRCANEMRAQGVAAVPRTCPTCGLGPCRMVFHEVTPVSKEAWDALRPMSQPAAPRTLPVNVPLPSIGVTIVTVDHAGNVTIKVDQVAP